MKAIQQSLDAKRAQLNKLQIEIAALEDVLRMASGTPIAAAAKPRSRRSNLKGWVIDLLKERGDMGLNANVAVEIAQGRGEEIERGSVSSLLSRLKSEGIVEHDGNNYRLRKSTMRTTLPGLDEINAVH